GRERLEADLVERNAVWLVVDLRFLGLWRKGHPALERDDRARLCERHRLLAFLRRDQIERTELIVFSPPSPVRELRHPAAGLGLCNRRAPARGPLRLLAEEHEPCERKQHGGGRDA